MPVVIANRKEEITGNRSVGAQVRDKSGVVMFQGVTITDNT